MFRWCSSYSSEDSRQTSPSHRRRRQWMCRRLNRWTGVVATPES